jgi:hypothetical protein
MRTGLVAGCGPAGFSDTGVRGSHVVGLDRLIDCLRTRGGVLGGETGWYVRVTSTPSTATG